jgi:diphthamide biosynthesis protein 3
MACTDQDQDIRDLDISNLTARVAALMNSIITQSTAISAIRNRIVDLVDQIQAVHREILEVAIRTLEQTMHGSVARGIKARAEHLAAVAKGLDLKIR